MVKGILIKIYGEVQGVFFRSFVKEKADGLELAGWVRNVSDGSVGVLAEGEEEKLKKLAAYCKEGPRFAKIDRVEIKWAEASSNFQGFEIK